MINKIYKSINNKYSDIIKFLFFIRHVFVIFLISISLFLLIPKFFNYEKKKEIIQDYLINQYEIKINDYKSIEYKVFPLPNLLISKVSLNVATNPVNLRSNNMRLFLNLRNIYNYKNFTISKIVLSENEVFLNPDRIKDLFIYFNKLNNAIKIEKLDLNLKKNDNIVAKIKNVQFSNYGFRKYHLSGEIFGKKFKVSLKNNLQILNFKLLKTGIKANLKFKDKNFINGSSKISLLNNILRFDFNLNNNQLKIIRSNFRNKNLSFSLDSVIKFNPFFDIDTVININDIDKNLLDSISLENILRNRDVIKKLNGKININYKSKKYFFNLIKSYSSDLKINYGRIFFSKNFLIAGGDINCKGDSILIDEYPRVNFSCLINVNDKKKLLKKFSISNKSNQDTIKIDLKGSINIGTKKINFKRIHINKDYVANEEDLRYYENNFKTILYQDGFFQLFNKRKIREFLTEIL